MNGSTPARHAAPEEEPDGDIVSIGPPEDDDSEPSRVALFEIGGTVYTMLSSPPPTLGIDAIRVSESKGNIGFAEVHVLREMMGDDALNALIAAGRRGWLKPGQYQAIVRRVHETALGALEAEDPNL